MWLMAGQVIGLIGIITLGWIMGAASVIFGARLVGNLRDGRSPIMGHPAISEPFPFVIKDDATERMLEDQALGYKPMETFDHVEGLGR